MGLLEERDRPLVQAMTTATAAEMGGFYAISIRGSSPFMSEAEERAKTLPSVYYQEYAGTPGAALDDEENWHAANPGS